MQRRQKDDVASDDGGRRRRGLILTVAFLTAGVAAVVGNLVAERRADTRIETLQADLEATFAGTTSTDLLTGDQPMPSGQPYFGVPPLAALTTASGAAPDLITADGMVLQARYPVDGLRRRAHCLIATWDETGLAVAKGDDQRCSSATLTLG